MPNSLLSLMLLPFTENLIPSPQDHQTILINSCQYNKSKLSGNIDVIQNFKPFADQWVQHGFDIKHNIKKDVQYDYAFCQIPTQKEAAKHLLAQSLLFLKENGYLIAVARNDAGGKRLPKWLKDIGLTHSSLSKDKSRIIYAQNTTYNSDVINDWVKNGEITSVSLNNVEYKTKPGIFGWDKIDKGSNLLIEHITDNLSGTGADFGCGYGFLSRHLLENSTKIKKLYAIDADYNALECCKQNLAHYNRASYEWLDLTQDTNLPPLDFIVMNPPFHIGKDTVADIGNMFIQNAAKSLPTKGKLYMVANAHLPYEKTLGQYFGAVQKLAENSGFKVFYAVK